MSLSYLVENGLIFLIGTMGLMTSLLVVTEGVNEDWLWLVITLGVDVADWLDEVITLGVYEADWLEEVITRGVDEADGLE